MVGLLGNRLPISAEGQRANQLNRWPVLAPLAKRVVTEPG